MPQLELTSIAILMGMYPGPLGLVVFIAVKFGGYMLAALVLKRAYPGIVAGLAKIAAVRTGIGLLLGIAFWLLTFTYLGDSPMFQASPVIPYIWLSAFRIVVWGVVISLFTRKAEGSTAMFIGLSVAGALWSGLLDAVGIGLALISPGQIPVC